MIKTFEEFLNETERGEDLASELGLYDSWEHDLKVFLDTDKTYQNLVGFREITINMIEEAQKDFLKKFKQYEKESKNIERFLKKKYRSKLARYEKRRKESGRSYIPPMIT